MTADNKTPTTPPGRRLDAATVVVPSPSMRPQAPEDDTSQPGPNDTERPGPIVSTGWCGAAGFDVAAQQNGLTVGGPVLRVWLARLCAAT
jgi:hypothetical protein